YSSIPTIVSFASVVSPPDAWRVRTTVVLVAAVNFFTMIFVGALGPLLPHLADTYGLSKTGAGLLTALYAAGVLVVAVPAGVAVGAGMAAVFAPAALAGLLLTAVVLARPEPPQRPRQPLRGLLPELRRPRITTGLALGFLSALLWAVLSVLAPLDLDRLGFT